MIEKAYGKFANRVSDFIGSVWSIAILLTAIIGTGIYFGFTTVWEEHLHTVMAFVALVAVFFVQRSQRHGEKLTNLKLNELIKALEGADNEVAGLEKEDDEVVEHEASK